MIEPTTSAAISLGRAIYRAAVCCSFLVGVVVILPFYVYGIPTQGAGDLQLHDVKEYWPFSFKGPGAFVHDVGMALAFVGTLVIPATVLGGTVLFLGERPRRKAALLPVLVTAAVGLAYLMNWRAIVAWHLD